MEAARSQSDVGADARREGAPARTLTGSAAGSKDVRFGLGIMGLCALTALVLGILSSSL
jgi:hypothetical protein